MTAKIIVTLAIYENDIQPIINVVKETGKYHFTDLRTFIPVDTKQYDELDDKLKQDQFNSIATNITQNFAYNFIYSSFNHNLMDKWRIFAEQNNYSIAFIIIWRHPLEKIITDASLSEYTLHCLNQMTINIKRDTYSFHGNDYFISTERFTSAVTNIMGLPIYEPHLLPATIISSSIRASLPELTHLNIPMELEYLNSIWCSNHFGFPLYWNSSEINSNMVEIIANKNSSINHFLRNIDNLYADEKLNFIKQDERDWCLKIHHQNKNNHELLLKEIQIKNQKIEQLNLHNQELESVKLQSVQHESAVSPLQFYKTNFKNNIKLIFAWLGKKKLSFGR